MENIKIGTCIRAFEAEKVIPFVIKNGFESISINFVWGFNNIDIEELSKSVKELLGDSKVKVSSIGFYGNPLQYDEHKKGIEKCIEMAGKFGCDIVGVSAGAIEGRPFEEAIPKFKAVFSEITKRAEHLGVKVAFENCPAEGTYKSTTANIALSPYGWERMFEAVPSDNLGLQWEPAHQITQLIDPIPQLYKWSKKIFHVHGKDATLNMNAVREYGIFCPNSYVWDRTPGFGDSNWTDIISVLRMNGYEGSIDIEGYNDPVYREEWEFTGQLHALKYLKNCRGGDYVANPWK